MTRIVQAANFVGPASGGIRTALDALGHGYLAAGHERVLVVPGAASSDRATPLGRRVTMRAPRLPRGGCYRVVVDRAGLLRLMDRLEPDRLEVSDKLTMACLGPWARARGVPAVVVSHERLDALVALRAARPLLPMARAGTRRWNRRLAAAFDAVVCTSGWAMEEFTRLRAANVVRVPLGVDLEVFTPARRDERLRGRLAPGGAALLVLAGRLWRSKRPHLAIATLAELRRRGVDARLAIAGDGPLRPALQAQARGLPVTFLGFLDDRLALAALLASADVVLAPGPVETFGLAALEALASGAPLVAAAGGALPELLIPGAGLVAGPSGERMAAAVQALLAADPAARRRAARRRAEQFPWSATVSAMLRVHRLEEEVP
jgi:alpha-1,6-mannosyltransferase